MDAHLCECCARGYFTADYLNDRSSSSGSVWCPPLAWGEFTDQQRLDHLLKFGVPWRIAFGMVHGWPANAHISDIAAPTELSDILEVQASALGALQQEDRQDSHQDNNHDAEPAELSFMQNKAEVTRSPSNRRRRIERSRSPPSGGTTADAGLQDRLSVGCQYCPDIREDSLCVRCRSLESFRNSIGLTCSRKCERCKTRRCYDSAGHADELHLCTPCAAQYEVQEFHLFGSSPEPASSAASIVP